MSLRLENLAVSVTNNHEPNVRIRWNLPHILRAENLTAYALEQVIGVYIASSTVYEICARTPSRIDLKTLAWTVWGLRTLTGKDYEAGDLLSFEEK